MQTEGSADGSLPPFGVLPYGREFSGRLEDKSYCLMVIDIEHFKLFNQWYGEAEGDRFLINIAQHLKKPRMRTGESPVIWGGDDFVIILPDDGKMLEASSE